MKLRIKFLLSFALVTGISLLVVSFLGYYYAKNQLIDNVNTEMAEIANAHVNQMDGWLQSKARFLEAVGLTINNAARAGAEAIYPLLQAGQRPDRYVYRLSGR